MSPSPFDTLLMCVEGLRVVNPTMTVQSVAVFLYVAGHPGCSTAEILERLGLHKATASNILAQLERSAALLRHEEDQTDGRCKCYRLAPRGERVARSLYELLSRETLISYL